MTIKQYLGNQFSSASMHKEFLDWSFLSQGMKWTDSWHLTHKSSSLWRLCGSLWRTSAPCGPPWGQHCGCDPWWCGGGHAGAQLESNRSTQPKQNIGSHRNSTFSSVFATCYDFIICFLENLNDFSLKSISLPPTHAAMDSPIVGAGLDKGKLLKSTATLIHFMHNFGNNCWSLSLLGSCSLMFTAFENNKHQQSTWRFKCFNTTNCYKYDQICTRQDCCHSFVWCILFSALVDIGKKSVQVLLKADLSSFQWSGVDPYRFQNHETTLGKKDLLKH